MTFITYRWHVSKHLQNLFSRVSLSTWSLDKITFIENKRFSPRMWKGRKEKMSGSQAHIKCAKCFSNLVVPSGHNEAPYFRFLRSVQLFCSFTHLLLFAAISAFLSKGSSSTDQPFPKINHATPIIKSLSSWGEAAAKSLA